MKNSIIVGVLGLIFIICFTLGYQSSAETLTIKVNDKERISVGSGDSLSHKYVVFTDVEVFENVDTLIFLKFDSSDVQNSLKIGHSYSVKVAGWRIPFMSSYRNIIEIRHE